MRINKTVFNGLADAAVLACLLLVLACRGGAAPGPAVSNTTYPNPQPVTIHGYSGSVDVPYLTPDGNFLVWDSRTDPGNADVKIYYAKKLSPTTFQFMGPVGNVNVPGTINFEMTIDDHNNFYFTRIKVPPKPVGEPSIHRGRWNNGVVTDIAPVRGLENVPGIINQDPSISHDGQVLIFDVWDYAHKCLSYKMATKNSDGSFTVLNEGDSRQHPHAQALRNVTISSYLYRCANFPYPRMTHSMLMGPVAQSHSGLTLIFTMIHPGETGMPAEKFYIAKRSSLSQPFGKPEPLIANGRVVEGPSFSPDDRYLYFHLSAGDGTFAPFVLTMDAKAPAR